MRILIVSATTSECCFGIRSDIKIGTPIRVVESLKHNVDALVTGIGAVPTTFALTRHAQDYDLVVNSGIAGAYKPNLSIGTVVCINQDSFGDYGIDDHGVFKSLSEMRLSATDLPNQEEILNNPWINFDFPKYKVPLVKGLTLSTASGSLETIEKIKKRWDADIETMESAAVFYVCKLLGVRFISYRAVSNFVEPRDKSKWNIGKAIGNLETEVRNFIDTL